MIDYSKITGSQINGLESAQFDSIDEILAFIDVLRNENTFSPRKESKEWWAAAAFSYYLFANNETDSITIAKGNPDPPDFVVTSQGRKTPIEIVFCVDEDYEKVKAYCRKLNDGSHPINTFFMTQKLGTDWSLAIQQPDKPLRGPAIYGNHGRIFSEQKIIETVDAKIAKYKSRSTAFDLIVYVSLPSNIYVDDEKKLEIEKSLSSREEWMGIFAAIRILWSKDRIPTLDFEKEL